MIEKPTQKRADFTESLPILLLRARHAVSECIRPVLSAHGVTEQQWRVLRMLSEIDEIEVTRLADAVFLRGPSLSRILKDLSARQLIHRRKGETDHRYGLVSIAPGGREVITLVAPAAMAAVAGVNALYGEGRMTQLTTLLHELEDALTDCVDDEDSRRL